LIPIAGKWGYPLSLDTKDGLFAAAIPNVVGFLKGSEDYFLSVNGLVGRREITTKQYTISKVAEDKDEKHNKCAA
jgi:hypothetical protein